MRFILYNTIEIENIQIVLVRELKKLFQLFSENNQVQYHLYFEMIERKNIAIVFS